jgi:hypothetical protein
MPTLAVVDGIRICMYYADHGPAHFHAIAGEHEIIVDLVRLSVGGAAPNRMIRRVRSWAARQRIGAMLGPLSKRPEAWKIEP